LSQQVAELKKAYKPMSMSPNTPAQSGEEKKEFSFKRKK